MTEDRQAAAAKALDEATITAGKATMYALAERVREEHPAAIEVLLSESDQGSWLWVDHVITQEDDLARKEEEELEDDDGLASHLYTDIWSLRALYSQFDVRGEIESFKRQGVVSFRMDVAKVLAECGPEPAPQLPTPRTPPLHLWGERPDIYVHAAGFIDNEEEGTAYYLNADHRPDQPGITLNREEVTALVKHAQGWLDATRLSIPGKTYDHAARPDDDAEPGDRCRRCGEDITWVGPHHTDWLHVDDKENR